VYLPDFGGQFYCIENQRCMLQNVDSEQQRPDLLFIADSNITDINVVSRCSMNAGFYYCLNIYESIASTAF